MLFRPITPARHAHPYDVTRDGDRGFSRAECIRTVRGCSSFCPRHKPVAYADHMARHATDSI